MLNYLAAYRLLLLPYVYFYHFQGRFFLHHKHFCFRKKDTLMALVASQWRGHSIGYTQFPGRFWRIRPRTALKMLGVRAVRINTLPLVCEVFESSINLKMPLRLFLHLHNSKIVTWFSYTPCTKLTSHKAFVCATVLL